MYKTAYALKNTRELFSSSGGAFPTIARAVALSAEQNNKKTVFYGAAFDDCFDVCHIRIDNLDDIHKICGSKYVGSRLNGTYVEISKDLSQGYVVVFSGTPCQVYALKKYLNRQGVSLRNLFTIDIICHGTIRPVIWKEFRDWIQKKYNSELTNYSFRYSKSRWQSYPSMAEFKNGKKAINSFYLRRYTEIFYSDMALEKKCYSCQFTNTNRHSDLTIGDFWGIRRVIPGFRYHENVSEVFINSENGATIIESINQSTDLAIATCLAADAIKYQQALNYSVEEPNNSKDFWIDYKQYGFEHVLKKYFHFNVYGFCRHVFIKTLGELGVIRLVKCLLRK